MPLSGSILIRKALIQTSIKYQNQNFVADSLYPKLPGQDKEAKVLEYLLAPWFRDEAGPRAPGGSAPVSNFEVTSQNFDPINYATGTELTDEYIRDAKISGNLKVEPWNDAMEWMAAKLDIKKEVRASAELHAADWSGNGAGGVDAAGGWGHATAASDTFIADMNTGRQAIRRATGITPNTLFLTDDAAEKLWYAPALLALIYPTSYKPGMFVNVEQLKVLAKVDKVIIGSAMKNTDEETVADTASTLVNIWGTTGAETKGVGFLYYAPETPKKKTPSAGYQYQLKQDNGLVRHGSMWRDQQHHKYGLDMEEDTQFKTTGTSLGYLWKDTATT